MLIFMTRWDFPGCSVCWWPLVCCLLRNPLCSGLELLSLPQRLLPPCLPLGIAAATAEQGAGEAGARTAKWLDVVHSLFVVCTRAKDDAWHLAGKPALPGRVLPCFALLGKGCRLDAAPRQGELSCKPCCKQGLLPKGPATQWAGVAADMNKHPRNSQEQPGNGRARTQESDKDPCGSTARVRPAPSGAAMQTQPREITGGVWVCKQGRAPCLSGLAAHAEGK